MDSQTEEETAVGIAAECTTSSTVEGNDSASSMLQNPPTDDTTSTVEQRIARDGNVYTFAEFTLHYGDEEGVWMWEEAATRTWDSDASERMPGGGTENLPAGKPSAIWILAHAPMPVSNNSDDASWGVPAIVDQAAPPEEPTVASGVTMDSGLQATFNALKAELRSRVEAFVAQCRAGSRLKLPPGLRPKQRKALHVWAEQNGLEHRSFGWARRRRLHLVVPGVFNKHQEQSSGAEREGEDFDWAAWADEPEDYYQ